MKKSPLLFRYPGGKYYAIGILRPFWLRINHSEFREPFVGGGSVFFNKPLCESTWLNDLDDELITTYKMISNEKARKQLIKLLENEIASKERWREVYEFSPSNELEVAFKYFYLNRTSFSGKLVSAAWGYRPKRSLPPERWHERIIPCGEKLEDVKFTSSDFEEVISDRSKNDVLLFVDPPYFKPPQRKHYRHGLTLEDHIRLADSLRKTKHKFFLTYDDAPEVRELYEWATITPVNFFYRVDNSAVQNGARKLGFELIISNYSVI
jgi:DNA adenine methylase